MNLQANMERKHAFHWTDTVEAPACSPVSIGSPVVIIAPKPAQPIDKGLPGPGLLAFVITSKYSDRLPLNRQVSIVARHGVDITRSTLCGWMASCAELLQPACGEDVLCRTDTKICRSAPAISLPPWYVSPSPPICEAPSSSTIS